MTEINPITRNVTRVAVRDIKVIASMVRGLIGLAEELGEAEDLQAWAKQEQQRVADLKSEAEKLSAEIVAKTAELETGRETLRQVTAQVEAQRATLAAIEKIKAKLAS